MVSVEVLIEKELGKNERSLAKSERGGYKITIL